jgi:hypothetical protein
MANGLSDNPPIKFDRNAFEKWFVRLIWLLALATVASWLDAKKTQERVTKTGETIIIHDMRITATETAVKDLRTNTDKILDIVTKSNERLARMEGRMNR